MWRQNQAADLEKDKKKEGKKTFVDARNNSNNSVHMEFVLQSRQPD